MNKDMKVTIARIDLLFKRLNRTRYWLSIVNDKIDEQYNIFFYSEHSGKRTRSTPLHSIRNYELEYLESFVKELRAATALSIEFVGFSQQRWPDSQYLIQKKRDRYE
ncbi:acetyl-CoA carboxylase (plasmid) [Lactiplantibacillus plantarum subsp. plantarum]|uniref:acetyl-CoA carboxylase n=1 Tax=Lactiplantibacillus plantarum TaxID=1590 RepID=UPI000CD3742C|nr:acetyl-CoA carboxylase [Lactiplantibacillus plantarum]AUV74121.1 acetyl-CoA carboxylase [Lactiplantibacillus plantarum subsp. plantarum]MCT3214128.1 acetyl-CoA carboxylase [Lactiplantibacillus plantarum]MCT3271732.1 acetyl-CoA carboxylase [Lactiplantibacillus plantarum]